MRLAIPDSRDSINQIHTKETNAKKGETYYIQTQTIISQFNLSPFDLGP